MAAGDPIAGTYTTAQNVGVADGMADFIERIDPEEAPFYSNARKDTVTSLNPSWQIQELRAPDGTNAKPEGFEATFVAAKPTDRLENVVQLVADTWVVSDTVDVIERHGRAKESAYQKLLTGLEIRRDVETILQQNQARRLTPEPRLMGGYPTYAGVISAPSGITVGNRNGDTIIPAATARDFAGLGLIDDVLERCYTAGGNPELLMMPPALKRAFSRMNPTGIAAHNEFVLNKVQEAAYIGSVSVYLSDFGRMETAMNRWMPTNMVFCVDFDYIDVLTLPGRNYKNTDLAKTGSSTKGMIEWEGTLRVRAPKSQGIIFALQRPSGL